MKALTILLVLVMGGAICGAWPQGDGEEPIVITGTLVRAAFPGRPNYESIASGDEAEAVWLLRSPVLSPEARVGEKTEDYQLVVPSDRSEIFGLLQRLGQKHVTVVGCVWRAQTGHHHTALLITVKEIKEGAEPGATDNPDHRTLKSEKSSPIEHTQPGV